MAYSCTERVNALAYSIEMWCSLKWNRAEWRHMGKMEWWENALWQKLVLWRDCSSLACAVYSHDVWIQIRGRQPQYALNNQTDVKSNLSRAGTYIELCLYSSDERANLTTTTYNPHAKLSREKLVQCATSSNKYVIRTCPSAWNAQGFGHIFVTYFLWMGNCFRFGGKQ